MECSPVIHTVDYHTAGEPFRIVVDGVEQPRGDSVIDKRSWAMEHLDDVRALLVNEPRGHADMYGGFVTDPDDSGADLGVIFFHKDGFSTACGHGTIALATWAIDEGRVPVDGGRSSVVIDVPSGRLHTEATIIDGRVTSVRFVNVTSFVSSTGTDVDTSMGKISVAVSFGGAYYGSVALDELAVSVVPEDLGQLIELGREIKAGFVDSDCVKHPSDERLSGMYGVIFHETLGESPLHQRNVTVFADGEVDRSPCGSGTSARLALLHAAGRIGVGDDLRHDSIVGSTFSGRVETETDTPYGRGVVTSVEGSAYRYGRSEFTVDPNDPLGFGFQLR
jgi:proline racemase